MTDEEYKMLDFAGHWWRNAGAAEDAIQREFNITATRYWQKVNRLLDDPAAAEYAPTTVARLRRIRATRTARRNRDGNHQGL